MANDYQTAGENWAAEGDGAAEGATAEAIEAGTQDAPTPAPQAPLPVDPGNVPPTLHEASDKWGKERPNANADLAELKGDAPKADEPPVERAATTSEIAAVIRAQINGKDIEVPEHLMIPLKRNGVTTYVPLKDVMASGMMEQDYRIKTGEVARQRQEIQQLQYQAQAEAARMQERAKMMQEEHEKWNQAKRTPEGLQQWQQHYDAMKNNPMYREAFENSQKVRESEAENAVLRQQSEDRIAQETTSQLAGQITAMGTQYPGVNPQEIMRQYGLILKAGEVDRISMDHVAHLYRQEADKVSTYTLPFQTEMETVRKELEGLRKQQAAITANAATDKAISRAKAPNTTPQGVPQSHTPPRQKPYTPDQAEEVRRNWSKG